MSGIPPMPPGFLPGQPPAAAPTEVANAPAPVPAAVPATPAAAAPTPIPTAVPVAPPAVAPPVAPVAVAPVAPAPVAPPVPAPVPTVAAPAPAVAPGPAMAMPTPAAPTPGPPVSITPSVGPLPVPTSNAPTPGPVITEDAIEAGMTACIIGDSGGGKTTCLRNLGRDGKKVLYIDRGGNPAALKGLQRDATHDWSGNWTIKSPINFQGVWEVMTSLAPSHDIIVFDEGTDIQGLYVMMIMGHDPATSLMMWDVWAKKLRRPANEFEWGHVGNGYMTFISTSRAYTTQALGGKDVIWIFQAKKWTDKLTQITTVNPDLIGRLKSDLPKKFTLNLQVVRGNDGRRWFLTDGGENGFAYHRFARMAEAGEKVTMATGEVQECAGGEIVSALELFEPPDLAALMAKVRA